MDLFGNALNENVNLLPRDGIVNYCFPELRRRTQICIPAQTEQRNSFPGVGARKSFGDERHHAELLDAPFTANEAGHPTEGESDIPDHACVNGDQWQNTSYFSTFSTYSSFLAQVLTTTSLFFSSITCPKLNPFVFLVW